MASIVPLQAFSVKGSLNLSTFTVAGEHSHLKLHASPSLGWNVNQRNLKKKPLTVVAAVGDVSSDSTIYLVGGAAAVALIGTAFPIFFSRKDLCPECDGAGFIRKSGAALRANAARKDQAQIVCPRCNGLGKLNQIDK